MTPDIQTWDRVQAGVLSYMSVPNNDVSDATLLPAITKAFGGNELEAKRLLTTVKNQHAAKLAMAAMPVAHTNGHSSPQVAAAAVTASTTSLLDTALYCLSLGWWIFPLGVKSRECHTGGSTSGCR